MEVIEPEDNMRSIKAKDRDKKVSLWGLNSGGRQENSLGTVHSISQVLYTNTGWSVHTCLGQAYILKMGGPYFRASTNTEDRWALVLYTKVL